MMRSLFVVTLLGVLAAQNPSPIAAQSRAHHTIVVPGEDRFVPFAMTINAGDFVQWVNMDTDDHTVVSDDVFDTAGHKGVRHLLPGTDSNGGKPGTFTLRFMNPGSYVFYCEFHAHLDHEHQPVAPGPRGGIQDPTTGNFGTPMSGVITVLHGENQQD